MSLSSEKLVSSLCFEMGQLVPLRLGYDLSRMRASYPHLTSLRGGEPKAMVDVKQLAYSASANRMNLRIGLATLTKFVLGATLSKAEQCSDWARRPLAVPQLVVLYKLNPVETRILKAPGFQPLSLSSEKLVSKFAFRWVNLYRYTLAYAAADAFYLNLIFDKCVAKSNGKLLQNLDEVVALGDPRAKGKHLPRKAKKAFKKQAALASRLMKSAAGGNPLGHTQAGLYKLNAVDP